MAMRHLTPDHHVSSSGGSLRIVIPNAVTFLSFACGLMAIRAAIDGRLELAVASIFLAICLDGIDGRLARGLNATSIFGAELDSLADCVSFGVAPALVLYYAGLYALGDVGWLVATCFAAGIAFRLARFNAELQVPRPGRSAEFFVGVPAPAGAAMALLPILAGFIFDLPVPPAIVAAYLLLVTGLCVSRLPVYSGKSAIRLSGRNLLLVGPPLCVAILLFPWTTLAVLSALFVAMLPVGLLFVDRVAAAPSVPAE
jgi:CDP-diacylglycerol---serine O-phosphatidyltransferase